MSSLVKSRMVGDAQVPLLRIIPVAGRDGEMMTRTFDHIQYCPLVLRRFQTVEIDIRDATGVKIPFERGPSLIPKLNPFFIPFWCFIASNALTILFGDA
jgi:hypothetical protein